MAIGRTGGNGRFAPVHVTDLHLEIGARFCDLADLDAYSAVRGIVRLHDAPLGYTEVATVGGRCNGDDLTQRVLSQHQQAILCHLLGDALVSGAFARASGIRDLLGARHVVAPHTDLRLTVAVCTRDRLASLADCLTAIGHLDYDNLDVLVVDNAPTTARAADVVRSVAPAARYVVEPRPGLSHGRNRAIAEAAGDVVAFVDDDCLVDRRWASAIVNLMSETPDVMAVTGLVVPAELMTAPQELFERHGGFGRGFTRRWLRRRRDQSTGSSFANTGTFGTGTNMAYRRRLFDEIGTFDPALGAGTSSRGGEDLDVLFRVLAAGHTLVYEPEAMVRHRHRAAAEDLREQIEGWGTGMLAHLLRNRAAYPHEKAGLTRLMVGLLAGYYPRRILQTLGNGPRRSLAIAEFRGALASFSRYRRARHGSSPVAPAVRPRPQEQRHDTRHAAADTPSIAVELGERLPTFVVPAHQSDVVRMDVRRDGRSLGTIDLVTGGHAVGTRRAADAIVRRFWRDLVDPEEFAAVLSRSVAPNARQRFKDESSDRASSAPANAGSS